MAVEDLKLESGKWLVSNCASLPSESNCKIVIMAPEDQKEDLIAAGSKHAIDKHGHADDDQLRTDIEGMITSVEV